MYIGLIYNPIIHVMLRYIRKESVFIDAGANIGYLSAIGVGCVGKKGQIHSFEPVPLYFNKLKELKLLNKPFQIFINNIALGDTTGTASIDINNDNIGANTMVSGFLEKEKIKKSIIINVKRLDEYIFEKNIQNISLIKIDVEGFEYFLLKGLTDFFEENIESLPPMIVEITPSAYPLLKCKIDDLVKLIKKYNYTPYSVDGKSKIDLNTLKNTTDILFMQD
jgi:FkbM family methyltransferase